MRSHRIQVGPESRDRCPYKKKGGGNVERDTYKGEGHVKTETDTGVMCLCAGGSQGLPTTTKS